MRIGFWLRWSWRGLRQRTPHVVAIAAIVALGSGIYAGLGSTSVWRTRSLDASFARLDAHDLEVATPPGLTLPASELLAAVRTAGGGLLADAEERLVVDLPVRAGRAGSIPAAGVVVGVDLARGVRIDRWSVTAGRSLGPADTFGSDVLLDAHFATAHHLPAAGTLTVAGAPVRYVGTVLEPEYLNLTAVMGATIQGAATRAVLFAPLPLAQRLAGLPGRADDVVVTVPAGADVEHVAAVLTRSLDRLEPTAGLTVSVRRDTPAVRALYDEITSEQRIFDLFALLVLAGAGFAAFNLTRRVVESQRRDIGIAMALGVPGRQIALRPMALAAEVAVTGVALGVVVGWGIGTWVLTIMKTTLPLPVWETPWQGGLFLVAAGLGLAIPLAGSAYPVWRAVRVPPTDAFLPPHLRGRRHHLTGLARHVRMAGGTLVQAPVRRVAIAPARSVTTVVAIALILAPLLAALGATDSTTATIDTGSQILSGTNGDRLLVDFTSYQPASTSVVEAVTRSPLVERSALGLDAGGTLVRGGVRVDVSIAMVDLSDPLVVPEALADRRIASGGIVLAAKAASDLGVVPGDRVTLRHPVREGAGVRYEDSALPVRAVVSSPYRFVAYMDRSDASLLGLAGIVNTVTVVPRPGVSMERLQRALAALPGVASALAASALAGTMRSILSVVVNLFVVMQVVIGLLAFLVAYNSSRIGSDERAREHATMLAFGVGVPRVVAVGVAESVLLGLAGAGLGVGLGVVVLRFILGSVFPVAVPQLAVIESVRTSSYLLTAGIGLAAAAAAPTLVARRLRTLDLPGTLRTVE